ncbi:hypothetical protein HNQ59_002835 [Chitinivorax tropicus]|uniref:Uncharacterized protein n=1 Tax=Chitinivorax tropicus TaxID=714531 RepID=A0A840MTD2_9PROT|nr:hypothetical protein [Chitinivorax tropicus]MBB5019533.1 hypothetical protein [Chitinivorax tropicus]
MGNPLRLILTGEQVANVTQGAALVEGIPTTAVTAARSYGSNELVERIEGSCQHYSPSQPEAQATCRWAHAIWWCASSIA